MDRYDLTVIGGGSAGLAIASGAASFGARVLMSCMGLQSSRMQMKYESATKRFRLKKS